MIRWYQEGSTAHVEKKPSQKIPTLIEIEES
jgi:hypothetical protein